ncbi:hypothetical protein TVAG_019680 [Trichomonas vaginalis G3]|uniref:Uncharacterized protein n=1 Tax=Trichomonas vaginalis (strain ATCC PRA-98 / G3) TaxID=412133 RepID=A2DX40_TRIV3|nr:hypothetical protein TVAGG3_0185850 [Trichomonas vaginalis G3]EAY15067.1 hypothetical protein TVAG_019680 [Trichomonas vaginalis G3]KAI5549633.1 hypothetical protein TVAGG3_0185850 [Trichomonas vaginalis G3]|eukprot:XP_001327290.1 hypothetical protein [Trichomonas vaginalis G3]
MQPNNTRTYAEPFTPVSDKEDGNIALAVKALNARINRLSVSLSIANSTLESIAYNTENSTAKLNAFDLKYLISNLEITQDQIKSEIISKLEETKAINDQIGSMKSESTLLKCQETDILSESKNTMKNIDEISKSIDKTKAKIFDTRLHIDMGISRLNSNQNFLNDLQNHCNELKSNRGALLYAIDDVNESLSRYKTEKQKIYSLITAKKLLTIKLPEKYQNNRIEIDFTQNETIKNEISEIKGRIKELKWKLGRIERENNDLSESSLQISFDEENKKKSDLENDIEEKKRKIEEMSHEIDSIHERIISKELKFKRIKEENIEINKKNLKTFDETINALDEEQKVLEQEINDLEKRKKYKRKRVYNF